MAPASPISTGTGTIRPTFTVRRVDLSPLSDNPTYLKQHERLVNGMLKAGVPEG